MKLKQNQIKAIEHAFNQGQQALQMQLWDVAEQHFKSILTLDAGHVPAMAYLAFTYTTSKQFESAELLLEKLLKTGQNIAQTHLNLANVLYEQSKFEQASKHFEAYAKYQANDLNAKINAAICLHRISNTQQAMKMLFQVLDIDKKNARAFYFLGMMFADSEDYPKALECLESATGLAPKEAKYRVSFAETLVKVGLDYEAGIELRYACESNPNYADSFIGYGEYLHEHRCYDEALEAFTRALALDKNNPTTLDDIAKTYASMGNLEKGLEFYNINLSKYPDRISSLAGKAQLLLEHGKSKETIECANEIINIDLALPTGFLILSRAQKFKVDATDLISTLESFIGNCDQKNELHHVHFALGKIHDDLNHYDLAFNHYAKANHARTLNVEDKYDTKADAARFDEIIKTFDVEFLKKLSKLGSDFKQPIVIVGMPRSGTTLTEQIISSHPSVMAAGEVVFWTQTPKALPQRLNTESPYPDCVALLDNESAHAIAELYIKTLERTAGIGEKVLKVTDKMPHNFLYVGLIAALIPNAKIIHTKRNAIDTCLSIFFQNFNDSHKYKFDLENLAFHYRQYERLMAHWHQVLPGRILDINYEDTIADPEYWTRKLIDYVGLEWDDACLAPHKLERAVKTASIWQVRQPIYKTSVERWRNYEPYIQPLIDGLNKPIAE